VMIQCKPPGIFRLQRERMLVWWIHTVYYSVLQRTTVYCTFNIISPRSRRK
jgi:hypothetical protein